MVTRTFGLRKTGIAQNVSGWVDTAFSRILPVALSIGLVGGLFPGSACAESATTQSHSGQEVTVGSGTTVIDASSLNNATSLNVSSGATAIIDFGSAGTVNLTGNVLNSGSIFAVSSNPAVTTASLSALNISNSQGAILSSVLPSNITYLPNLVSQLNLSLNAVNQIFNAGIIASSGSLSMSASNIVNQSVMSATQNMNLAVMNNITNSGLISSAVGNINITNLATTDLLVNNMGGRMEALLGNINLTAASALQNLAMNLSGGDFISKQLNIVNPGGSVDIGVKELLGTINITACNAHVLAETSNLTLGNIDLSGDPTFYNTTGSITFTSDLDLRPANFTTPVAVAVVAAGDIVGSGITTINVSVLPNNLSPAWPGANNGNSILLVAGAQFTSTGAPTSPSSGTGPDTTSTLTITGASTSGGSVNLSGVSLVASSGTGTTQPALSPKAGNVTVVAYKGTTSMTGGNINIGSVDTSVVYPASSTPGPALTPTNDTSGVNGQVVILGEGNITVSGTINASGNIVSPLIESGNVLIASSGIKMMQSSITPQNTFAPTYVQLIPQAYSSGYNGTTGAPGQTTLAVSQSVPTGVNLYLNPLGPNAETVQATSITTPSYTQANLASPLQNYHGNTEQVFVDAPSVVVNPGAGTYNSTNVTTNGSIFAPDRTNLMNGTITLGGQITAGGTVTVLTGGAVNLNSNIGLTQNPTSFTGTGTAPTWIQLPTINLTGSTVTIGSSATISTQISGCNFCPGAINIYTQNLVNNGTLTGGPAAANPYSNSFINVQSSGALAVSGSGNFTVPIGSVIELAAADNNALTVSSALTFNTGSNSLLIFNAQGSTGSVTFGANQTFTGSPIVSINTPTLNLNTVTLAGGGAYIIGSGYQSPALTINLTGSNSISSGPVSIKSGDSQTLTITGTSSPALTFTNPAILATTGGAAITTTGVTLTGNVSQVNNPSGNIRGVAFQPYVGGRLSSSSPNFVAFGGYPYHVVLALLGPLVAPLDQNSGSVSAQFDYVTTYTQAYSAGFVIQAAKQVGLRVSAGAFVDIQTDAPGSLTSSAYTTATSDIQIALYNASVYGNVLDLVVGNEDIVTGAGGNAGPSISTLTNLINGGSIPISFSPSVTYTGAKPLRTATTNPLGGNYNSTTLPVTTRQKIDVLNLVTDATVGPAMVTLMNACEGYVYGNIYPFFDESNVVPSLIANPSNYLTGANAYTNFKTLVTGYLNNTFDIPANNFISKSISNKIRIGETGWATPMLQLSSNPLTGYVGNGLPQQNTTWAYWYYPIVQEWSSTHANPQGGTGVIVADYFDGYNEPWKGINGGAPNGQLGVTLAQNASAGSTSITTNSTTAFTGLTPASVLLNPGGTNQEVQNIFGINSATLNINNANFPGSLINAHTSGEVLAAGFPQEPFFGIWVASGSSTPDGSVYQIGGVSQQYSIVTYPTLPQTTTTPPAPSAATNTVAAIPSSSFSSFLALSAGAFDAVAGANSSVNRTGGVIIPTDINPERAPNDGNPTTSLAALNTPTTLFGNLSFLGMGGNLNPAESLISLPSGNALLFPDHDMTVETPLATVKINAGAAVMIMQNSSGVAIFNLFDNKSGDVTVSHNGDNHSLPVGRQVVLTSDHDAKFDQVNPSGIGYRNLSHGRVGSRKAFASEFSFYSAISSLKGLRDLLASNDKGDMARAQKLLKTAAAFTVIGKQKEQFQAASSNK
ncbi:MAG: hypothetical protein K2W95_32415 [Candidatus Obscuribacterales bacterium]|nr:hypothetical protein [Candidatus Obscuribacterales bacterium]